MRIDKYLKLSRIIKRRTLANQACEQNRVCINGKIAKPSSEIKIGDMIEIKFGNNNTKIEVISLSQHATKNDAKEMYILK